MRRSDITALANKLPNRDSCHHALGLLSLGLRALDNTFLSCTATFQIITDNQPIYLIRLTQLIMASLACRD